MLPNTRQRSHAVKLPSHFKLPLLLKQKVHQKSTLQLVLHGVIGLAVVIIVGLSVVYPQGQVAAEQAASVEHEKLIVSAKRPVQVESQIKQEKSPQEQLMARSKYDIAVQWSKYKPFDIGGEYMANSTIFEQKPQLTTPYKAGKLKKVYVEDGLKAVNFVRYLAGIPHDVTLDWTLEQQQQTGALVNALNESMSHTPNKPAQMAQKQYEQGYKATSHSNIYYGSPTLYDSVIGYMSDQDSTNIKNVAHRRYILNPWMKQTMFGFVFAKPKANAVSYKNGVPHSAMYVMDNSREASTFTYDYISWPAAGYFPEEVFEEQDPWSVLLHPEVYNNKRTSQITVELVRERDQKRWRFDKNNRDTSGKYFNVETSGYGSPFAIIFRPDAVGEFAEDDRFTVLISGLFKQTGEQAEISYETTFFPLLHSLVPRDMITMEVGETLQPLVANGAAKSASRWKSSQSKVVKVDSNGKVTALAPGQVKLQYNNYFDTQSYVHIVVKQPNSYDRVSKWAQPTGKKAREAGLLLTKQSYGYQGSISRYDFVEMAAQLVEVVSQRQIMMEQYESVATPFKDAKAPAIHWAYQHGIVNGTSQELFSPKQTVNREQAATILLSLYRYLDQEIGTPAQQNTVTQFRYVDDDAISSWAKSAIYEAEKLGLLKGDYEQYFHPKALFTKEQTIVAMYRLFQQFSPYELGKG
ncbi:S-layer homology domain-containing protein [Paenibacillus yanchengensis]|uniref:S-layer homology domain-containing protein n=1 Tax=Paenibacillus yanchengensis TaxID=2035833 RepID=A0ABW4YMN4_9BACL